MKQAGKAGEEGASKYNRAAEDFARTDKGEKAAAEAERALGTDEADEMRKAEERGRAPAKDLRRK